MSKKNTTPVDPDIIDPAEMYLTVELEDGSEETYQVLTIYEVDGRDYIAVAPKDGSEDVYFYRYAEDADGNPSIDNIASDDEYEAVIDMFDQLLDDEEFDRM